MTLTLNISEDTAQRIADMHVGMRVDRASAILANGAQTIFTVSGGNILLTGFYGEVMVAIDTAATLILNYDADISTNLSVYVDTVLGSISANPNGYAAGRMAYLPIEGGAITWTAGGGACPIDVAPIMVLPPGHFDLTAGAATVTGKMRWSMFYIPLEAGVNVVAN
jgi:hypothetical protein